MVAKGRHVVKSPDGGTHLLGVLRFEPHRGREWNRGKGDLSPVRTEICELGHGVLTPGTTSRPVVRIGVWLAGLRAVACVREWVEQG